MRTTTPAPTRLLNARYRFRGNGYYVQRPFYSPTQLTWLFVFATGVIVFFLLYAAYQIGAGARAWQK